MSGREGINDLKDFKDFKDFKVVKVSPNTNGVGWRPPHPLAAETLPHKRRPERNGRFALKGMCQTCKQSGTCLSMQNGSILRYCRRLCGWKKGFEPSTFGTTIRHSNQLSYIHHLDPVSRIGVQK